MAISVSGGTKNTVVGTYGNVKTYTYSTATADQTLSLAFDVSILPGSTATSGFLNGRYNLPTGATDGAVEGLVHEISKDATGPAWVLSGATGGGAMTGRLRAQPAFALIATATKLDGLYVSATGAWAMTASNQMIQVRFRNGLWDVIDAVGATMATAAV